MHITRDIERELASWRTAAKPMPILLRGARQVGKSTTVERFGEEHFETTLVVNFEQRAEFKACFETLDPTEVVSSLSLVSGTRLRPGRSLLFLDEVQDCPNALLALRYFREQMPELHVLAAGSLLEFVVDPDRFRLPVGRIRFLYMVPLSFGEYLGACGRDDLRHALRGCHVGTPLPRVVHEKILSLLDRYVLLGGMPAVVSRFLASGDLLESRGVQNALLWSYRESLAKYTSRAQHRHMESLFEAIPRMVGRKFRYVEVDPDVQAKSLKPALRLLFKAGVVTQVRTTNAARPPLGAGASSTFFKTVFLDVGLMQRACGIEPMPGRATDLLSSHAGAVAEQLVGQELVATAPPDEPPALYYWARDKRGSSAEVDYLLAHNGLVHPVEVKAGHSRRLKSLRMFLVRSEASLGVRVCQDELSLDGPVLTVPLYAVSEIPRLLAEHG